MIFLSKPTDFVFCLFYEYPYLEIDQNVSSHRWQEFIKIATIISLKNMLTI